MTKDDWRTEAFWGALRMVGAAEPKNLVNRAKAEAEERGKTLTSADLTDVLQLASTNDAFLSALGMQVHKWDAAGADETWTQATGASTVERRDLICSRLGLDPLGAAALLEKRPIFHDHTIVISAPWTRWYTAQRAAEHAFYWPRYRDYLSTVRKWPEKHITSLDLATSEVIERLTDPTRAEAYQSKGLVVGYVQSGKTANFTGVVAKAIDAGYRLIIVMTGTIEMLRGQTQRRIDMEMVGKQNILGDLSPQEALEAKIDYQDDEAWVEGRFLDLETETPVPEIRRFTLHRKDYQKQFKTLKIDRFDTLKPLYHPDNLFKTAATLVVVKKNAAVLRKLVTDITANKNAFAQIPVLIIDDESDQASVNTVDPEKVQKAKKEGREIRERRAINERIANMLDLMPRAQYIGYTATPFANVFVDPSDPQGIFPRDFVIGLQRPDGYMGVDDFHDLEFSPDTPKSLSTSNELAHVRDLEASEDDEDAQMNELAEAIDMFVLTGAVKLYRESNDNRLDFRHHTMLVHHSVRKAHHKEMAEKVQSLWTNAAFSKPEGKARLRSLFEKDVLPVSTARLEPGGVPPPSNFDALAPFVSRAIDRITEHSHNPVIVVNSDADIQQQSLDFDRQSTWRILVGGAKLSRGFTVEGLTVTYFRRATKMSDSLTQMGRWFGFREGYRDLVRLYIARRASFGRKPVDMYEAFESVALDEAAFRKQLEQYAEWDGDAPRIRPIEIPPLVSQHLPWLPPTARNKMFNAVLDEQSEQPFTPSGYTDQLDELKSNLEIWRPIFSLASKPAKIQGHGSYVYEAFAGVVSAEKLVSAIESTLYLERYLDRAVTPRTTFYRRLMSQGLLEDLLVVVPQPDTDTSVHLGEVGERRIISRDRRDGRGGKFGEMTEPKHRPPIQAFVGLDGVHDPALSDFAAPKRGAVLLYIARETNPPYDIKGKPHGSEIDEEGLVAAFSVYMPEKAMPKDPVIRFRVHDKRYEESPTIDVPDDDE